MMKGASMRISPIVLLLCMGVLGCGPGTKQATPPSVSPEATAFKKGVAFADKEDWATAIACFTEAIRTDPDDALAYNNRGIA